MILDFSIYFSPLSTSLWLWSPTITPSTVVFPLAWTVTHLVNLGSPMQTQCAAVRAILLLISVPPQWEWFDPLRINLTIHGFELGLTSQAFGPPILTIGWFGFSLMQSNPSMNSSILLSNSFDIILEIYNFTKKSLYRPWLCGDCSKRFWMMGHYLLPSR